MNVSGDNCKQNPNENSKICFCCLVISIYNVQSHLFSGISAGLAVLEKGNDGNK